MNLVEQVPAQLDQIIERLGQIAKDCERDLYVLGHGTAAVQRRSTQRHRASTDEGVVGVFARAKHQPITKTVGQFQYVTLIGALVAQRRTGGVSRSDGFARPISAPRAGPSRRRRVVLGCHVSGGNSGRCGHARIVAITNRPRGSQPWIARRRRAGARRPTNQPAPATTLR